MLLLLLYAQGLHAQVVVNVVDFGATGDGATDDRAAIQNAIDYANNNGGGTVFFPAGTYIVSPVPNANPQQVICLKLYDNIALVGVSRDVSVIKLQDNAPNFDAIIGNNPSFHPIDNIQLRHLCFDANGANNPIADPNILNSGKRSIFRIFLGKNYLIEDCRFTHHKGVWCVVFNGITENIVIRNNEFTHIGDANVEWDHSSIYTNGDRFLVENNYFHSLLGPGTKAARTAIEIHGSNQVVRNNTIVAYPYGINATGFSELYPSFNQTYCHNTFLDVMNGIVLWSSSSSNPLASNGLKDIRIFENKIEINALGWKDYDFYDGGAGIVFERNRDLDIDSLYIFNNEIVFVGEPIDDALRSRYSSGIRMGDNNYKGVDVQNTYILNNAIKNSNGPGMNFDFKLTHAVITGNSIENAASSSANLFTGFRSGIYVGDTIADVQISCNSFEKTRANSSLGHLLYSNGTLLSNAYFFGNVQKAYSVPDITNGSLASGLNWTQTADKPLVQFGVDSVRVGAAQSVQVPIALDAPAPATLQIHLIPVDRNGGHPSDWSVDSIVTFNAGEQIKTFSLSRLSSKKDTHYLIIRRSDDYLINCGSLLKIYFDDIVSHQGPTAHDRAVRIYPNPTQDYFAMSGLPDDSYRIALYDTQGRLCMKRSICPNEKLPVSHLSRGVYVVRIFDKNNTLVYSSRLTVI